MCSILDETMSGELRALKVIKKTNSRLDFLYGKDNFLTPVLPRLLCKPLMQPHFNYASSACYPNFNQKIKNNPNHSK